jgi:predicted dithiol-disulfide oxidoreductase (DUF899 family)
MKNEGIEVVREHAVVSHEEWLAARSAFLREEKEFTRLRDELNARRRALPWERVTKDYRFDGTHGSATLADLFAGRSQLVVYHAMFDPQRATDKTTWNADAACHGCSFWADHFSGIVPHLNQRDVTLVVVSRAPVAKIAAFRQRMGWTFDWFSSGDGDFNFDFGVSFTPEQMAAKQAYYNYAMQDPQLSEREGVSVFCRDADGAIFHTYSTYARGLDMLNVAYHYLDIVPKGRDEGDRGAYWLRRRDEYEKAPCCA